MVPKPMLISSAPIDDWIGSRKTSFSWKDGLYGVQQHEWIPSQGLLFRASRSLTLPNTGSLCTREVDLLMAQGQSNTVFRVTTLF